MGALKRGAGTPLRTVGCPLKNVPKLAIRWPNSCQKRVPSGNTCQLFFGQPFQKKTIFHHHNACYFAFVSKIKTFFCFYTSNIIFSQMIEQQIVDKEFFILVYINLTMYALQRTSEFGLLTLQLFRSS